VSLLEAAAFVMTFGTALTVSCIAAFAVYVKHTVIRLAETNMRGGCVAVKC